MVTCLLIVSRHPRRFTPLSPSPRDLCALSVGVYPACPERGRRERSRRALDYPFSFVFFSFQLLNFNFQASPPSNSFTLISFADPHPLNSVISYRYKIIGGQGPSTFQFPSAISHPLSPFFSNSCGHFPRSVAQQPRITHLKSNASALFAVATRVCQHGFSLATPFAKKGASC